MKKVILIISLCIGGQCISQNQAKEMDSHHAIPVLNFGTFHMGFTSDETTTEFDENDSQNQKQAHEIAKKLAKFNPTVIIVETLPKVDKKIQNLYFKYVENPKMKFKNPNEIHLIAFELGRLSGAQKIYGIDHRLGYNYGIGEQMNNKLDSENYSKFSNNLKSFFPDVNVDEDSLSLLEKLKLINHDQYLDYLIAVNADMLTHVGSEKGFEGADEAAKYYKRNLRMFSNLNRIELTSKDRVFILMGASHTAFFRDFISRNPKFKMVDSFKYLD